MGALSLLHRHDVACWRTLKAVNLNRWTQYYIEPWMERLLRQALARLTYWMIQARKRLHTRLLHVLVESAHMKKNRELPTWATMKRTKEGYLARQYLAACGMTRRAYTIYCWLKHG